MSQRTVENIKADLNESVTRITEQYPKNRSAIMPALYLAQEKYGKVDGTVYQAIAEILDVPEIYVFEVASFYTMYNRQEVGVYHIQLCTNISCMLLGAYNVLTHMEKRLGIKKGQTTEDGLFTISVVECIGSCDVAPAMMVNDAYYDNLTAKRMDEILDELEVAAKEVAS